MITKSILGENKDFATKEEALSYVKQNLNQIIDFKKGIEQKSIDKGVSVICKTLNNSLLFDTKDEQKAIKTDSDYYYIAVNTTNILDSHDDVHAPNIWNKTSNDMQGKNYLVDTHELSIGATIVKKEHIEMFVAKTTFKSLGMPYDGSCNVLVYKFRKDKVIDAKAKEWLESGDAIEASVRMRYVSIKFCVDSNAPEDADFKKNYDENIDKIANKGDFEYIPYFFWITEAQNVRESSLCPFGSNSVTGNIISRKNEPSEDDTQKTIEPTEVTQEEEQKVFINSNLF